MYKSQLFARKISVTSVDRFIKAKSDHIGWQCLLSEYGENSQLLKEDLDEFFRVREVIKHANIKSVFLVEPSTEIDTLSEILNIVQPDIFMPGGPRTPEVIKSLHHQFPKMQMMIPIPIPVTGSRLNTIYPIQEAERYAQFCQWFLTDTITADGKVGCSGQTADWKLMFDFINNAPRPVIAAGGLNPSNIQAVVSSCSPVGFDAHTAVCTPDGYPDSDKAQAFVQAVKAL